MSLAFQWPKEEAKRAKLHVPAHYDPYQQSSEKARLCYLDYDEENMVLLILAEDSGETLDVIDPEDMIGAAIEVNLLDSASATELRSTTTNKTQTLPEGRSSPTETNAPSTCNNEPTSETPTDTQAAAKLALFVYPREDLSEKSMFLCGSQKSHESVTTLEQIRKKKNDMSQLGNRNPCHCYFQVAPSEDLSALSVVVESIKRLCRPHLKQERYLVVVNPVSGKDKNGKHIYETIVMPMLEQAGVCHDFVLTTHAGHAVELMNEKKKEDGDDSQPADISTYDAVIGIGGDGIIAEIINGIKARCDCEAILKKIKLGHIGAGTSNGLSKSLVHASNELHSPTDYTFLVAKGKTVPMDLSRYQTASKSYLSFLTFSWGIIADMDIESEVIRFMGALRFDIWGVWRVINLRKYRAKFSYLPPSADPITKLPPLDKPVPEKEGWVISEDDFILFWASQVTHAAEGTFHSPHTIINGGIFHIFIVRNNASRFRLAMILLGLEHGSHVDMEHVEFIKCTAFRLEPISKGSFNDLDGEVIEPGPVQGMVLPSAVQTFCKPKE